MSNQPQRTYMIVDRSGRGFTATKTYWQFHIVKWDETGNVLLKRHVMTVQRQSKYNAVTAVRKKFPPTQGYFEELNSVTFK